MNQTIITDITQGLTTAFIDHTVSSNLAYRPQFVSNNYKEGRKVISSIEDELLSCEQFAISVAFITMSGITPLLQTLKELEKRGIPGRILTTDYLTFSDPKALRKLEEFSNLHVKMYVTDQTEEGFHTKGYIFKKEEMYRIIVGSSNMTLSALTVNREWNTRIVSTEQGKYAQSVLAEFEDLWNLNSLLTVIRKTIQEIKSSANRRNWRARNRFRRWRRIGYNRIQCRPDLSIICRKYMMQGKIRRC